MFTVTINNKIYFRIHYAHHLWMFDAHLMLCLCILYSMLTYIADFILYVADFILYV